MDNLYEFMYMYFAVGLGFVCHFSNCGKVVAKLGVWLWNFFHMLIGLSCQNLKMGISGSN